MKVPPLFVQDVTPEKLHDNVELLPVLIDKGLADKKTLKSTAETKLLVKPKAIIAKTNIIKNFLLKIMLFEFMNINIIVPQLIFLPYSYINYILCNLLCKRKMLISLHLNTVCGILCIV